MAQVTNLNLEKKSLDDWKQVQAELKPYPHLQSVSLRDNRLTSLGKDAGKLKKVKYLDLRGNPLKVQDALEGLYCLPLLKELFIDITSPEEERIIRQCLPKLQLLNGHRLSGGENDRSEHGYGRESHDMEADERGAYSGEAGVSSEEVEQAAALFESIRLLWVEREKDKKNDMAGQMEEHIKRVLVDLGLTLKEQPHPLLRTTHSLKARYAMAEPPFVKAIELLKRQDARLASVFEEIHDLHTNLFRDLASVVFDLEPKTHKLYANYRDRNLKAFQEANSAQGAAEKLFKENQELISGWESDRTDWQAEKSRLMREVAALEAENKKYLAVILKHSKSKADEATEGYDDRRENRYKESEMQTPDRVTAAEVREARAKGEGGGRVLTLKQLNEAIEEIYVSKLKCDQKYIESRLPRETMEQHMYTFLNTKYGLKTLIIEWAAAIVHGIQQYGGMDNNVAVFGKILRNECDEEFRFVQAQVKTTIAELLKMLVKGKFPYKNKQEVADLVNAKTEGYLSEDEVQEIVRYMYSKEDASVILGAVKSQLSRGAHLAQDRRLTREERLQIQKEQEKKRIKFSSFQKIVLDFQLRSHENFLARFVSKFRQVDKDQNGILDEQEFRTLMKLIDPRHDMGIKAEEMLDVLDPFSNDIITFSSVVTLLSSQMIDFNGKQLSVLHRVSLDNS